MWIRLSKLAIVFVVIIFFQETIESSPLKHGQLGNESIKINRLLFSIQSFVVNNKLSLFFKRKKIFFGKNIILLASVSESSKSVSEINSKCCNKKSDDSCYCWFHLLICICGGLAIYSGFLWLYDFFF